MATEREFLSGSAGSRRPRVLVAKPGLDGHDRGAKVIARALRDAGYEVIYTGLQQSPEQVVAGAIAEDVAAIGLSVLSGAHVPLSARVLDLLDSEGAGRTASPEDRIPVVVGGIIPDEDRLALLDLGVAAVFTPGASLGEIVAGFDTLCRASTQEAVDVGAAGGTDLP